MYQTSSQTVLEQTLYCLVPGSWIAPRITGGLPAVCGRVCTVRRIQNAARPFLRDDIQILPKYVKMLPSSVSKTLPSDFMTSTCAPSDCQYLLFSQVIAPSRSVCVVNGQTAEASKTTEYASPPAKG